MKAAHFGAAALLLLALGCRPADTSKLSPEREAQLVAEKIRFRAANLSFRFSHDQGTRDAGWENRTASIVVTDSTVLIFKNEKVGVEITPSSRKLYQVSREKERVRVAAGSGQAREVWSFVPPDSAAQWTEAIRAVIKTSHSVANER
jgi:hypothetical protein